MAFASPVRAFCLAALACTSACAGGDHTDPPAGDDAGPGPLLRFSIVPATIGCADDNDPDTADEQFAVVLIRENADGDGFDTLTVTHPGGDTEADFDDNGRAVVPVTLRGGPGAGVDNTLTASSTNGDVLLQAGPIVVTDTCTGPPSPPPSCAFEQPVPGSFDSPLIPVRVVMAGGNPFDAGLQALLRNGDVRVDVAPGGRSQALITVGYTAEGTVDVRDSGAFTLTATVVGTDDGTDLPVTCAVAGIIVP